MSDFLESLFAYRRALDTYWAESTRRKIDNDYRCAGRQCRRALRRVRKIAARHGIFWDTSDNARTFY